MKGKPKPYQYAGSACICIVLNFCLYVGGFVYMLNNCLKITESKLVRKRSPFSVNQNIPALKRNAPWPQTRMNISVFRMYLSQSLNRYDLLLSLLEERRSITWQVPTISSPNSHRQVTVFRPQQKNVDFPEGYEPSECSPLFPVTKGEGNSTVVVPRLNL